MVILILCLIKHLPQPIAALFQQLLDTQFAKFCTAAQCAELAEDALFHTDEQLVIN